MKFGLELRAVALLRRIARALEDANALERRKSVQPRAAKLVDLGVAKTSDWNDHWRETHGDLQGSERGSA